MAYKDDKKAKKDEIMSQIEALKPKKELKDLIDLLLIEWQEILDQHTAAVADDCINRYRDSEATVMDFSGRFILFMVASKIIKDKFANEKDIQHIKEGFMESEGLG